MWNENNIGLYSLNPFMNQVFFYKAPWEKERRKAVAGLNPFMNQVFFYRRPPKAAPGAGLRACLREPLRLRPVLHGIIVVIVCILLKLKEKFDARPFGGLFLYL